MTIKICLLILSAVYATHGIIPKLNMDEFKLIRRALQEVYGPVSPNTADKIWFHSTRNCNGFVKYDQERNAIIVSFKGTEILSLKNWAHNVAILLTQTGECRGCRVHHGYKLTYESVRSIVLDAVSKFHEQHPTAKIYVTGYSLGAVVAVHCAVDLTRQGILANLMTFGSPRPGNAAYANYVNKLLTGLNYRITFKNDIATETLSKLIGYRNVGTEVIFDRGPAGRIFFKILPALTDVSKPFRPIKGLINHYWENYFYLYAETC